MPKTELSVNRLALKIVERLCDDPEKYGVIIEETEQGVTLIDAGIKAKGGYLAGKVITEICMGGLGKAKIFSAQYNDLQLPSIFVYTDHPTIAMLGSQLAGWKIKVADYQAIGSGPARALSLKPRELYRKINYKDKADTAVIVLEAAEKPTSQAIRYISEKCHVNPEMLYLLTIPTTSLVGSVQISGRIVEVCIHKLINIGFNPTRVLYGCGYAPIAPVHPKFTEAMGRTNDSLIFAGQVFLTLMSDENEDLEDIIRRVPACASSSYGKTFHETLKETGFDLYKIDPELFAPAMITVNDLRTGKVYSAGKIDTKTLKISFEL